MIRQCAQALQAYSKRVSRIRIVAGGIPQDGPAIPGADAVQVPQIGYSPIPARKGILWKERSKRLADMLVDTFGGADVVWWIHNHHLGKNPLFTEAVLRVAGMSDGPRMVLQPHDFPEAGRFGNLRDLDRTVTLPLYPEGERVRYALINRRDLELLTDAGVAPSRLFLLENPVTPLAESVVGEDRTRLRSKLFPRSDPMQPTLLYPVRSIRRKNVLEAGMLLRLVDTPLRLIATLPGVSRPEKRYSELVAKSFRSGLIPGEFATGVRRPDLSLENLAAACDMVVSSSVQEGFGYLFIQALQWGLPLLARRLDTIPGAEALFGSYPAFFYSDFLCPLEGRLRSSLRARYKRKLRSIRRSAPARAVAVLENELFNAFARDSVDFSYLDTNSQTRFLEASARSSDFRSAIRALNGSLVEAVSSLLSEHPRARHDIVNESFGLRAYASRVDQLLESFDQPLAPAVTADPADVQQRVRSAFLQPQYLRLLLD